MERLPKTIGGGKLAGVGEHLARFARRFAPAVGLPNAIGLFVLHRYRRALEQQGALSKFEGVAQRLSETHALELSYRANPQLWCTAGIVQPDPDPLAAQALVKEWWLEWYSEILTPLLASSESRQSREDELLYRIASRILDRCVASPAELCEDVRRGLRWSRLARGPAPRDSDEESDEYIVAEYWDQSTDANRKATMLRLDQNGRVRIRDTAIRDKHGRRKTPASLESAGDPAGDALEAVDAAASAETGAILRDVVEGMSKAAWAGSAEFEILTRFDDLLNERATPAGIARQLGRPERTLQDAWQRIKAQLSADDRLRQLG